MIAPLLLVPFAENSFKHGAHRLDDKGFVRGSLIVSETHLYFTLENDILELVKDNKKIGGIGIGNVQKQLDLNYPTKHDLKISYNNKTYKNRINDKFKMIAND